MAYGQTEPGLGFLQIDATKNTGAGTGTSYGDTLAYVRASDNWQKAVAGSVKPFGFNGTLQEVSKVQDMQTGIFITVIGTRDADTGISVVVSGRIEKIAGGAIPPGELVMPDATDPVKKVMAWDGTTRNAVMGRYIRNVTNFHNVDTFPAAANNDAIMIDIDGAQI